MKITNVLKRGNAWIVSLAMLVGMLSVLAATTLFGVSQTTPELEKFVANFSELGAILREDGKDSVFNSGTDAYKTAYTPLGDTSTTDGKLNTWMGERFASKTSYTETATRAWFSQGDFLLQGEDPYNGNGRFTVSDGVLRHQLGGGNWIGEMLRRVDTLIPQYSGTNVRLKNFEARLTFTLGMADFKGALVFNFHEADAGSFVTTDGFNHKHTGNTLVIGNGAGIGASGKDGWAFHAYDAANPYISATTIDTATSNANDTVVAHGVRFDRTLDDQKYLLVVRVVGRTATFTLTSEDGTFTQTMSKTVDEAVGYMSFGVANRDTKFYSFEISELDDDGNEVDYGTQHNGAVETFYADFTDLPDAHYNNGAYKYDSSYVGYQNPDGTASITGGGAEYAIDVKATGLADYLENKFDFFVYAYGGGGVMERWNAAGYFVDAQGNNMGSGFGTTGKDPSTGKTDVSWMPGNGIQGDYPYQYPTMKLSGNKWLQLMNDWNANWVEPFQISSYFKVKNADGTDAVLKNFKLDLDFKLTTASADAFPQNQSPIFVKFGGYDGVIRESTDGAMFAISCGGGYFLDDLNTSVNGSTFMNTHAGNGAPYYTENVGAAVEEAHLTLIVKNGTVQAIVTAANGTELLNVTKNDIQIQSGLVQIGTSYAGIYHGMPYFGAVEITRLNDAGEPIDFNSESVDTFDASFVGLTDYREGNYYSNNGKKSNTILSGKAAESWLTKSTTANFYQFGENDTTVTDYLSDKFTFYHIAHDGNVYEMATPFQNTQQIVNDIFTGGGAYWGLCNGRWLRAQYETVNSWGELFRKQVALVPKLEGEQLMVSDFTASFDLEHHSFPNDPANNSYSGGVVAFTFHSSEAARLTSSSGTFGDAVTLVFTRNELVIYDGTNVDFSWQDLLADSGRVVWSNDNADAAHVELKVLMNKMDLKVTSLDGKTVYYEVTGKQLVHRDGPGYVYFNIANSAAALGDISITPIYREDMAAPSGIAGGMKTISGLIAGNAYEYKLKTASDWTAVPVGTTTINNLTAGYYEVRLAASKYCAASPATLVMVRDGNIIPGDGTVTRFEADFAKLADAAAGQFDANGFYVPQQSDTAINTYITERFGLYYNNNLRHAEERAYAGQNSVVLENDPWGGESCWRIISDGTLQRFSTKIGGEMMRKAEVLTLKAPNGNYASLKNFEAEYTVVEDHQKGAITLSFRSADYNHVICTDGYFENQTQLVFENQETVIIGVDQDGKHGITLGSGDVHGRKENGPNGEIINSLRYVDTEIPALVNYNEYTVTVKALGDKLTVVIRAADNSVIWDNTATPFTLKRNDAGYMLMSVTNAHKGIKGLVITQLDDEGNPVDFGTGTRQPASHYDAQNTTYYDFSDASQMNDFDTYFLPEWSNLRKPLIKTTNTQYNNWYVANGSLHFKETELYREPATLANGVEIGGTEWKHALEAMVPYTGNLGVAVLKTKSFENFILEMDFTGQNLWTQVGFGAANTVDGVYHSTADGGYNLALANEGKKASAHFFYAKEQGYSQKDFVKQFDYNDRGTHHLQMIVSDNKLYVSLNGSESVMYDVPEAYKGGYIYFTLNNPVAVLDNIRIVDLDEKLVLLRDCVHEAEDQVIDRAKGEMFKQPPTVSYGTDKDGYEYPVFITLENEKYRSYKDGTFDFKIGIKKIHGISLSNEYNDKVTVTNRINNSFNTENSRKYYFDHPNDFLDFGAYYSELRNDKKYWEGTAEGRKPNGTTEYWSAYQGELVEAENVTDKWQLNGDGTIGNAYYAVKGGASPTQRLSNFSTLVLIDCNLLNFRAEVDVKMGDSWWYNFLGVGIQDPTAMYYALGKNYNSTADGGNTGFKTTDVTKKGGAWAFVEQEGYINLCGNLDGGVSERFEYEPEGYDFIKTYDKNAWHHIVIEVVDGVMSVQVDNSMKYYLVLDNNAIGGHIGIGSYGNKSLFKNLQLTALNADGEEVPFSEAKSGFGAADFHPEFFGWNTFKKLWDFDWLKKHTK